MAIISLTNFTGTTLPECLILTLTEYVIKQLIRIWLEFRVAPSKSKGLKSVASISTTEVPFSLVLSGHIMYDSMQIH